MLGRGFAAFLFDMDGTVLDSIAVADRVWTQWATRYGLDAAAVTKAMHGVRAVQTVRRFAPPGVDADHEAALVTRAEMDDVEGIVEIAGAKRLLNALPPGRWAIVTSAPRRLALRRLNAVGLPIPDVLITAEDVIIGKPAPDCYIAAAEALGVKISDCLIWEDAPAGIEAAEAAGATVVIVAATHPRSLQTSHTVVEDYERLVVNVDTDEGLRLTELSR